MSKRTKNAVVPEEWWERKRNAADKLGVTTPQMIQITEKLWAEVVKNKKRSKKDEFTFTVKIR